MSELRRPQRGREEILLHPYDVKIIGLDTSHKSWDEHPLYDPRVHDPLDPVTQESVRTNGVLVPPHVKKDGPDWLAVDGRGHFRMARVVADEQTAAGIPRDQQIRVLCIRQTGDDATLMLLSRALNSGRRDDTPYRNAQYASFVMRKYSKPIDVVANAFGASVATMRNWLALLDLGPEGVAALESGVMSPTAAGVVVTLPREEQAREVALIEAETARGEKPSIAKINDRVRDKLGKAPSKTPSSRVVKATELLTAFADAYSPLSDTATRAELQAALNKMHATLEKVSRALTDKGLAKLAETSD